MKVCCTYFLYLKGCPIGRMQKKLPIFVRKAKKVVTSWKWSTYKYNRAFESKHPKSNKNFSKLREKFSPIDPFPRPQHPPWRDAKMKIILGSPSKKCLNTIDFGYIYSSQRIHILRSHYCMMSSLTSPPPPLAHLVTVMPFLQQLTSIVHQGTKKYN